VFNPVAKKTDTPEKSASSTAAEQSKPGIDVAGFIRDSKDELGKVIWPSRQQLISESLAVVLTVSLSAAVIYGVNNLFQWAAAIIFIQSPS
jgi:preprotein translocase subunit SecE